MPGFITLGYLIIPHFCDVYDVKGIYGESGGVGGGESGWMDGYGRLCGCGC